MGNWYGGNIAWTGVVPPYAASTSYVYPYCSTSSSDGSWKVTLYTRQLIPSHTPPSIPLFFPRQT